jgi:hypothetical protein
MKNKMILALVALAVSTPAVAADPPADLHIVLRELRYHETMTSGAANVLGAVRVGMGELYDETATKRVGSMLMTCANTEVEGGEVKSSYCSGVMKLEDGVLTWSAASGSDDQKTKIHNLIFTGGSGAYANMRGYGFNKFATSPSYQEIFLFRQH